MLFSLIKDEKILADLMIDETLRRRSPVLRFGCVVNDDNEKYHYLCAHSSAVIAQRESKRAR